MQTGLDRLLEDPARITELGARRFALLAHPASVDRSLRHVSAALAAHGLRPRLLLGPEHGYGGEAQDMIAVGDARDRYGVPIRSLYGDDEAALAPNAEDFEGIDTLVIDLQDIGTRFYTFVWTAVLAARVALAAGKEVWVLDRPNPLGGERLEGEPTADRRFLSFVGLEPLPIRHGLTLGEIVRAFAPAKAPEQLRIFGVRGLERAALATAWDRPFVITSPNMPRFETALVYPGGCLLEGTNVSEGRGCTLPFETFGAPFVDGHALAAALHDTGLPGFVARPLTFMPMFHKHAQQLCGGVQLHVSDVEIFRPVATYAAALAAMHHAAPEAFAFRRERYEFRDDVPALDLLAGGADLREAIEAGRPPREVGELASSLSTNSRAQVVALRSMPE